MSLKCAVIDLGSNSARLGIYNKAESGQIVPVSAFRYTSRLSEGLAKGNLLTQPAMERTLIAFKEFKAEIDKHDKIMVKCVATEALRRAENSDFFIGLVKQETGISIEILSGEQEAMYGLFGAKMSTKCDSFYMLDTGGGSFELALCENGFLKHHTSLPYGAVVMTEKYNPDKLGNKKLYSFIKDVFDEITWAEKNNIPVVLLGGSNRVLGKIYGMEENEPYQEGLTIKTENLKNIMDNIISLSPAEREKIPGMEKGRVDIINAGLAPLYALLEKSGAPYVIISTNSIREGIAYEILNKKTAL